MQIVKVWFDESNIFIQTNTGHIFGNPISWFARLANATSEQRNRFVIGPTGAGVHWQELDEDLSLAGFLNFNQERMYARILK